MRVSARRMCGRARALRLGRFWKLVLRVEDKDESNCLPDSNKCCWGWTPRPRNIVRLKAEQSGGLL
eukprot:scaffold105860_cov33-Tisochrysis_lutea.AAC.1